MESISRNTNKRVKKILPFYVPKPQDEIFDIWEKKKSYKLFKNEQDTIAEDEKVEDAGLDDDIFTETMQV